MYYICTYTYHNPYRTENNVQYVMRLVYNKTYIFRYNIYCRMIVYNIDIKAVYGVNTESP